MAIVGKRKIMPILILMSFKRMQVFFALDWNSGVNLKCGKSASELGQIRVLGLGKICR
jgi:hypothetical protein